MNRCPVPPRALAAALFAVSGCSASVAPTTTAPSATSAASPAIAATSQASTDSTAEIEALVARARQLASPAFREEHREPLRKANEAARLEPTPKQFEAQLALYQAQELERVFERMAALGGPEITAYAFALAEDGSAPIEVRQRAVSLLERVVDARDAAGTTRMAAVKAAVAAGLPPAGKVPDAVAVVSGLQRPFRRCYAEFLAENPHAEASVRLTLKVDATGAVSSATTSPANAPAKLARCLEQVGRGAKFSPPAEEGATVVVPVAFRQDP